jgi:hypothetical protein
MSRQLDNSVLPGFRSPKNWQKQLPASLNISTEVTVPSEVGFCTAQIPSTAF